MRRLARLRARLAPFLLVVPAIVIAICDVMRRHQRIAAFDGVDRACYALALCESALLWGGLLLLAARRRGALRWVAVAALVILGPLSIGSERYFFDQFETYLNADAVLFGTAFPASLRGQIRADMAGLLFAFAAPLAYFALLALMARHWVRPSRHIGRVARAAAALPILIALLPCSFRRAQAATPDVIWFHAMGGLARQLVHGKPAHVEPGLRRPPYIPAIEAKPRARRNVLFVLTESVRYDAVCVAGEPDCKRSPFTQEALPSRIPFVQMRSNSSTTAISFGVLLSGLWPTETRNAIHSAPLLFDYAHAAGYDGAYWTSQHLMFAHSEQFVHDLPVSRRCGATDLDPDADIDMGAPDDLLTARVKAELPLLREPWFAVVHYSSTHFPYRTVEGDEPFQPASSSKAPEDNAELLNHYQNAVYAQDRTIADLMTAVRHMPAGARTVVLFTSDHGEAFRDHGQLGHTGSVYEEEIHVPAWVDAPPGTLTDGERTAIAAAGQELAWHVDVAPTILDLLGIEKSPELSHFRGTMSGRSLLARASAAPDPVPLTNCSELWGCAFRNWGMMRGSLKLEARAWDFEWHCWDVLRDPREERDLGAAACGALAPRATELFGGLPRNDEAAQRWTER